MAQTMNMARRPPREERSSRTFSTAMPRSQYRRAQLATNDDLDCIVSCRWSDTDRHKV